MSADWIKMRVDLLDDPAVIAMAMDTGCDEYGVVGRLHKLWSWADRQTVDGNAPSVTETWLDRFIGVTGFANAMQKAGWLMPTASGLTFPNFDRHNGKTAKKRALTASRVGRFRRNATSVTQALPEKEKEKEKELTSTPKTKTARAAPSSAVAAVNFSQVLQAKGIPEQVAADWLTLRKGLKAAVTETAIRGIEREAAKAGLSLGAALAMCCERGWRGFKAEWIAGPNGTHRNGNDRDAGRKSAALAIFGKPEAAQNDAAIIDISPATSPRLGR